MAASSLLGQLLKPDSFSILKHVAVPTLLLSFLPFFWGCPSPSDTFKRKAHAEALRHQPDTPLAGGVFLGQAAQLSALPSLVHFRICIWGASPARLGARTWEREQGRRWREVLLHALPRM